MKDVKRYFSYLGKYKTVYWLISIVTIISSVTINMLYPYMNKIAFNAFEQSDRQLFYKAVILCGGLLVLSCLFPYLRYFQIRHVRKIVFDIKLQAFHKLMKMDMNYYEKHHSAEAVKILNHDANSLKDSYFSHVYWVCGRLINGVSSLIAMIVYSPKLAVVAVAFSLITVWISIRMNKTIKQMNKRIQQSVTRLVQSISDILSGFIMLKMYSGGRIVLQNFYAENDNAAGQEKEKVRKSAMLEMCSFMLGLLGSFGTIVAGAFFVGRGEMDYGTVMAVVSLQVSVSFMVQSFGSALSTFSNSIVKAGRVFDFLELDSEENCGKVTCSKVGNIKTVNAKTVEPIVIENMSFAYDYEIASNATNTSEADGSFQGETKDVFKNFNLTVQNGEKIALVGESGCGKSTLLKLLLRFHDKTGGKILLYGQDISEYSLDKLRDMITYIPQNNYLFEGTIWENITAGRKLEYEAVNDERIVQAAKFAYADEFINKLPLGYDTPITAGGSNLSGGQRQRIAIARAFYKDAPIILMDEPSSALDIHSEKQFNMAMEQLTEQKIVIMVTHRMTSAELFDRVVRITK